jgi:cytosine/adenosine deaminase-related metal-dependent hydrolase
MLAAGVGATVICVNPQEPDVAAEVSRAAAAVQRCGIRAAIVYPLADAMSDVAGRPRDTVGWSYGQLQQHLDALEEIAEGFDDPRIEFQLGPVGPQWVSDEVLRAIGSAARRSGRRVHMHLLETRSQRRWADTTYPEGIIEFLDQCDLLGPQTCFAHGTHLRADELGALAASGAVVALNPSSNLRLASGVAPVDLVLQSKGEVALGLDGMALGDDADYWSELRLLRGLGQAQSGATIGAGALLDAVLAGGRCALGACAPAPFAVGNVADFCVMDFGGYGHLQHGARWSMAELAMAAGKPALVREVWVAGRLVWHREAGGVG